MIRTAIAIANPVTPAAPSRISLSRDGGAARFLGGSGMSRGSRRMRDEPSSTVRRRGFQCLLTPPFYALRLTFGLARPAGELDGTDRNYHLPLGSGRSTAPSGTGSFRGRRGSGGGGEYPCGYKLVQRVVSKADESAELPKAIR